MSVSNTHSYRPEIDGLRAIAVSAVVLYHFGVPGIGGGFVGVDVFFVISGFLIGGLLWSELKRTGRIDLRQFFLRRIRRLAPAYFLVITVIALVAYAVLLPAEFRDFGKFLIAANFWLSNVQFFREAGYFDVASESKVLLHTWSLAVEEQFYVALPLLLLLFRRLTPRCLIAILVTVWIASLAGSLLLTPHSPTATFFLFPFRAWELLSGVLLAIWGQESAERWQRGPVLSWLGLLLILGSVVAVRPGPGFPGWQALWPVAGSVLLILNGRDNNLVNRLLSARVPVFIGLISYSLYLWHWPTFTLSVYWRDGYGSAVETVGWMLLSVVLATVAWALVERPARRHLSDRTLLTGFLSMFAITLAVGAGAYVTDGVPGRFKEPERAHVEASTSFFNDGSRCTTESTGPMEGLRVCRAGPEGTPEVLFWGDSHLRAQMAGVLRVAQEAKVPVLIVWHAGCPPLFGLAKQESAATPAQDKQCLAATEQLRHALSKLPNLKRIVMVGRWSYYVAGAGTGVDVHHRITLSAAPQDRLQGATAQALYDAAWELTASELSRNFEQIYVLRQVPEMPRYIARNLARQMVHGRLDLQNLDAILHVEPAELAARMTGTEAVLKRLSSAGTIRLIDPWPLLCRPRCGVVHDGLSFYFDNNHLSNAGAEAMRTLWLPALTGVDLQ